MSARIRGKPPSAEQLNRELIIENQQLRQQVTDLLQIIKNLTDNTPTHTTEPQSPLFTLKAIQEHKQTEIINALQHSYNGRYDKARALATELKRWHADGYMDLNYNATVIYKELEKLITLPFRIPGFRKYLHNY